MSEPTPVNPHGWCAPHLTRGKYVPATTLVAGTSMCEVDAVTAMASTSSTGTGVQVGIKL